MTMADVLMPSAARRSVPTRWVAEIVLILGGSLVVALSAQAEIPLAFTRVPITGQTFGVLLVGMALGSERGAAAMALYLVQGAAGLPVFAGGGLGLTWLLGPTGGYLWSYPVAAWAVGRLAERGWDRRPSTTVLAMLAGNALIYLFGLPWLATFVGSDRVWMSGLLPFIPGDIVKVALAAAALPGAWKLIGRVRALGD